MWDMKIVNKNSLLFIKLVNNTFDLSCSIQPHGSINSNEISFILGLKT